MDGSIDEGLLMTIFVKSFGDRFTSQFSSTIFALVNKSNFILESVTTRLLQELVLQQ